MKSKAPFPWHHYIKTVRTEVLFIIVTAGLTYTLTNYYHGSLSFTFLLALAALIVLAFIIGFFTISPFRHLLQKIEEIQVQLPHNKKLDLIYRKDEWVLLDEMLRLTQSYIFDQDQNIQDQQLKSNAIIQYIPDCVVIVDKFLNIKEHNSSFEQSFINKITTKDEVKKLWKIFEFDKDLCDQFIRSAKSGDNFQLRSHYFKNLNQYFNISITPIFNSNKEITAALGIFHNTTQEKLNDKMRVDFVANVSHEIRTPLTSIKGYTQLLEAHSDKVPKELTPVLKKINSNTDRLKDLFENLLKLSKIESQYQIEKQEFHLESLLNRINGQIKGKYLDKNFSVDFIGEQELWGDEKLLEQVFINLIDNSIKYSDKKQTKIQFKHSISLDEHIISIKDNGVGLDHAEMNRIFERFYRVQGKNQKAIEGSGLGLSIVKHIINRHHGSIQVKSEIGVGSDFIIKIPNKSVDIV